MHIVNISFFFQYRLAWHLAYVIKVGPSKEDVKVCSFSKGLPFFNYFLTFLFLGGSKLLSNKYMKYLHKQKLSNFVFTDTEPCTNIVPRTTMNWSYKKEIRYSFWKNVTMAGTSAPVKDQEPSEPSQVTTWNASSPQLTD